MIELPSSKEEAISLGQNRYFTGEKCKRNHLALRSTANGRCVQCSKILKDLQTQKDKTRGKSEGTRAYRSLSFKSETSREPWAMRTRDQAKVRSTRGGFPFSITKEDVLELSVDFCPILGIELDYTLGNKKFARDNSPSIDRIIPELGYVKENIIIISYRANSIKQNATPEEILKVGNFYANL